MNSNLLRHRLLDVLTRQYIVAEKSSEPLGVSFKKIVKELKCSESVVKISLAELYENKEIDYHDAHDIVGVHATLKGVASFSNRKYKRFYWTSIKDSVKYWFQILVPVLSLLIALMAVTDNYKVKNQELNFKLQEMQTQIEFLQSHMEQLKFQIKDSLKFE